ncbi:hypothetical protein [Clostridium tyrobutyricum]|uniref:hypothetical protein n=1 Tax=Clostridium tyrobutyricum TaxID=1519 RepID=UPI00057C6CA3|nr:hypothetical protein [Clostridium tyrobutyricum]
MIKNELFKSKNIESFLDDLESFLDNNQYYLLDIFPQTVLDNDKLSQYEMLYNFSIDDKNQSDFIINENKFINILKKLWLYNKTKVFVFDFNFENPFKSVKEKKKFESIINIRDKTTFIKDINQLEILIKLGIREKASSILFFDDMEIICWLGNGLNCCLYFNNESYKKLIQKMSTTEGLYLYEPLNN